MRRISSWLPLVALAALLLFGCGSSGGGTVSWSDGSAAGDVGDGVGSPGGDAAAGETTTGDTPGDTVEDPPLEGTLRGACAVGDLAGFFEVVYGKNYSYFSGEMNAYPVPAAPPEELLATGACTFRKRVSLFCASQCQGGEVCDAKGQCIDYPDSVGVGTVTVSGLLSPVSLEPTEGTGFYFDTSLSHPPFDPGSPIRLDATGGDDAAFTLYGLGVEKLETTDTEWVVTSGQPVAVSWTPGSVPEAKVEVTVSIDQLGLSPAEIICLTEDTGSLEIAADLVDELLAAGISGFSAGTMTRRTIDADMLNRGCVELRVYGSLLVPVTVQ